VILRIDGGGGGTSVVVENPTSYGVENGKAWLSSMSPNLSFHLSSKFLFGVLPTHISAWEDATEYCVDLVVAYWETKPCPVSPKSLCTPHRRQSWTADFQIPTVKQIQAKMPRGKNGTVATPLLDRTRVPVTAASHAWDAA